MLMKADMSQGVQQPLLNKARSICSSVIKKTRQFAGSKVTKCSFHILAAYNKSRINRLSCIHCSRRISGEMS